MLHVLGLQVVDDANISVREVPAFEAISRPTPVQKGEPDEDLDVHGVPSLPSELRVGCLSIADEEHVVARIG